MSDLRKIPLPQRDGPVSWSDLALVFRQILARQDARNPANDFASGLLANDDGTVTLGSLARSTSQRLLTPLTISNKASVQSTSTVLTATSGASTSTVEVAAHSLKFDFGTVAYSAGSISGLTPETTYLIYCIDAEFAGGAVTYLATTNPDNLMAAGAYYVGYVITPVTAAAGAVSAASNAAAAVLTVTAHGYTTGQSVIAAAFAGGTWNTINTNIYVITVLTANTFSIPVDSSAFGVYTASSGTVTRITTSTQSGGGGGAGSGGGSSTGTRWDGLTAIP